MNPWRLALNPRNWGAAAGLGAMRGLMALPHAWIMALGGVLGRLAGRLLPDRRLVAETNLAACFPKLDATARNELVGQTLAETGRGVMEAAMALWWSDARLRRRLVVHGAAHWQAARGQGVLLLSAHVTMAELVVRLVSLATAGRVSVIARQNAQPLVEAVVSRRRARYCDSVLEKKDLRGLLRQLRAGEAVLYGPDQDFSYNSVFADFFGVPAATLRTTGELAERTGCVVLPTWCHRDAHGVYHLQFFAPPDDFPTGDAVADATRVNEWIEGQVRAHPAQYLWIHRRFKTRPPGSPPFYPRAARRPKHR